jgi:hypothetical protein
LTTNEQISKQKHGESQENMIPQKINNHITKDPADSEGDETSAFKLKKMIRIIKEVKEDMQKQVH